MRGIWLTRRRDVWFFTAPCGFFLPVKSTSSLEISHKKNPISSDPLFSAQADS